MASYSSIDGQAGADCASELAAQVPMPTMKRVIDFVLALGGLVVLSPLIILAFALVRWESPGPGLFRQTRVGRFRKPFVMYKLRTMHLGTQETATHLVGAAALTRVGRIIRRFKLDELPQLINVVKGEMSLVGPRPCLPTQTELIAEREKRGVFLVRPGITGLGQVSGVDMSEPRRLAMLDSQYAQTNSVFGDLALILRTVRGQGGNVDRIHNGNGPSDGASVADKANN